MMPPQPMSLERAIGRTVGRILANTDRVDECMVWRGNTDDKGYGITGVPNALVPILGSHRRVHTHFVINMLVHGTRPTPEHETLHACDNPPCVNPEHMRWGTQAENVREAFERGLRPAGERHGSAHITDARVLEILDRNARGESAMSLAQKFQVDVSTIYKWKRGEGRMRYIRGDVNGAA